MASYTELFNLQSDSGLRNRIAVATVIAAEAIRSEDPGTSNHANRLLWAAAVFDDPHRESRRMFWAVIAGNSDASIAQILGATDVQVQAKVDAAVDLFATGV